MPDMNLGTRAAQALLTGRTPSFSDCGVRRLTPQRVLLYFSAYPKKPFKIPIPEQMPESHVDIANDTHGSDNYDAETRW